VNLCRAFPVEDLGHRSTAARWRRGGGGAVTASTLAALLSEDASPGSVEYCCVFGNDCQSQFLAKEFEKGGVVVKDCQFSKDHGTPTATVILNEGNGSKTTLRSDPGIPDVSLPHFREKFLKRLNDFDWVHFEGKNVHNVTRILTEINNTRSVNRDNLVLSVHCNEPETELLQVSLQLLLPLVNVVFLTPLDQSDKVKVWGGSETILKSWISSAPNVTVILYNVNAGAWASSSAQEEFFCVGALPRNDAVETSGASERFIGAFIFASLLSRDLKESLHFACRFASCNSPPL
jgi:sugar/nucleoside kinase (ribokinase family)